MKKLLPSLLSCITITCLSLTAAEKKKDAVPDHKLSEYRIGEMITNDPVTMESIKGKVVVLEMWGIHCGPCLASMPELESFYKQNKNKGLAVVGLHSQEGSDEEVKTIVKQKKVSFPITKGGGGPTQANGIPRSLVFDVSGKLIYEGLPGPDMEKVAKKALREAAATASGDSKESKSAIGSSSSSISKPSSSAAAKPGALLPERPWKNTDGKIMTAALISVDGDKATFKKRDGTTFTYAVNKLNEEDQATIKEAADKAKAGTSNP
ncbi:MAG TPA: TlpA disulfide reductase family protein [Verrucomicrobiales bacterium]|jgi:thiol-disulfide isomerase/thioredoxin|nr:TlpA disulfide reductase family protein [Verrucomicrobiales bacterium]